VGAVTFPSVRIAVKKGHRSVFYVTRDDGSEVSWTWPSPSFPHDLAHYVVESRLGLSEGFWGLVAAGVDFTQLQKAMDRSETGAQVRGMVGRDATQLVQAEAAAAGFGMLFWPEPSSLLDCVAGMVAACGQRGVPAPACSPELATEIRDDLVRLTQQWTNVPEGKALDLDWPSTLA
jgi:hypothetical protein